MARTCGGRTRTAPPARHRPLSAVPAGSHPAGLPVRRGGDPDSAARGQPRQPDRVVRQSDTHPGVCAADIDRRTHPDVESLGGGQLLPGPADPGPTRLPAAVACPDTGDRCGGGDQPGVGAAAHPHPGGGQLPQLAAGLRVLVCGRDVARRMDRQPDWLGAQAGPQPASHHHDRSGGLPHLSIAAGRA